MNPRYTSKIKITNLYTAIDVSFDNILIVSNVYRIKTRTRIEMTWTKWVFLNQLLNHSSRMFGIIFLWDLTRSSGIRIFLKSIQQFSWNRMLKKIITMLPLIDHIKVYPTDSYDFWSQVYVD